MDEANSHGVVSSKMDTEDILEVLTPHHVVPLASRNEEMPRLKTYTDGDQDPSSPKEQPTTHEHLHGLVRDPIYSSKSIPSGHILHGYVGDAYECHSNKGPSYPNFLIFWDSHFLS